MGERDIHISDGWWNIKSSHNIFNEIISLENLFWAWKEFRKCKRNKFDVQSFEFKVEDNLFQLHNELKNQTYRHADYTAFYITDPKLRHINKASVRDRVLHQAVFRVLYPIFDKDFIADSYSCRLEKGTHLGVTRLEKFLIRVSQNNHRPVYYLKGDVRKFFDSVDHPILLKLMANRVNDEKALWLIRNIIESYQKQPGKALPLGNVTSQLFANIYLNELDQFVKHVLKERFYLRYCDDFVILNEERGRLTSTLPRFAALLKDQLSLNLHPAKMILGKFRRGIDFLGYVVLPHCRVLRTRTKKRMFKRLRYHFDEYKKGLLSQDSFNQSLQSYLGVLRHCHSAKLKSKINGFTILRSTSPLETPLPRW